jgi:copper chaperone CopZ
MKKLFFLPIIALLLGACSGSGSKSGSDSDSSMVSMSAEGAGTSYKADAVFPEENIKMVSFDIQGMTCEGCEKAIVTSISKLDGIRDASASHTAAEAKVSYDSTRTSIADISQAIADAGYTVAGTNPAGMVH